MTAKRTITVQINLPVEIDVEAWKELHDDDLAAAPDTAHYYVNDIVRDLLREQGVLTSW